MCMGNGGCFRPFGFVPCVATPEQDIGPSIRLQCVINKVTESPIDHDSVGDFNPADGLPPEYEVLDVPFDSARVLFLTGPDARDPIVLINSIYQNLRTFLVASRPLIRMVDVRASSKTAFGSFLNQALSRYDATFNRLYIFWYTIYIKYACYAYIQQSEKTVLEVHLFY